MASARFLFIKVGKTGKTGIFRRFFFAETLDITVITRVRINKH